MSLALSTARLSLRELSVADAPATNAWESDPRVTRYQSRGPATLEESVAFLARIAEESARTPRRLFELAVTTREDPTPIGRVGLMIKRPDHREAELWYVMRHDVWGRGYAVEALEALLDHAFETLGVHRVYGDSDPRNTGSVRVMEKLGMRREAHLRENWFLHGEWCDSLIFGVLEDEWRARRARLAAPPPVVEDRPIRVLGVAGSLGASSSNAVLVADAARLVPEGVTLEPFVGLGALPLFDPDHTETPPSVEAWRAALRGVDAVLVSTPEYGHSLPGVVKNAVDWVIGSGELERKPVAITASVPHADRGRRGLAALAQTLGAVSARLAWSEPIVRGPDRDRTITRMLAELARTARTREG